MTIVAQFDPLNRFSDRVRDYVKYRPTYPKALLDFIKKDLGLSSSSQVADVGSGTGIFTRQLIETGSTVFAVEPNAEMRNAAEEILKDNVKFQSISAPAEATGLPSQSVDVITAAQAFHWFDVQKAKLEWKRILRPNGIVVLIWNERKEEGSPFLEEYENLLKTYGTDYNEVRHRNTQESGMIDELFSPGVPKIFTCENEQIFDFEGLKGRLLSSSYAPPSGHPKHAPMIEALSRLFERYKESGHVRFEYETKAYYGTLS